MAKSKVSQNFGKGVAVEVKDGEHFGITGTTTTDRPDKDGNYTIKRGDNTEVKVHANHLALAVEPAQSNGNGVSITIGGNTQSGLTDAVKNILLGSARPYIVREASIKDGVCNYSFEILTGVGAGDVHKVTSSSNLIMDDMADAFAKFNVHLAAIDDIFKHSGVEITDIDSLHNHSHTLLYNVTGFKISGGVDDESIVLKGSKYVGSNGRLELATPKIPLDNLSSYKWYNELKAAADAAREEVALYKEGKYTVPEKEEEDRPNPKQLTIGDAIKESEAGTGSEAANELDEEFENAKV